MAFPFVHVTARCPFSTSCTVSQCLRSQSLGDSSAEALATRRLRNDSHRTSPVNVHIRSRAGNRRIREAGGVATRLTARS